MIYIYSAEQALGSPDTTKTKTKLHWITKLAQELIGEENKCHHEWLVW